MAKRATTTAIWVLAVILLEAPLAFAVTLECVPAAGPPGGTVDVVVRLTADTGEVVGGAQVDLQYDAAFFDAAEPGGESPNCVIHPDIGPGTEADKRVAVGFLDDSGSLRAVIFSQDNLEPIPPGPLFVCTLQIPANTPRRPSIVELIDPISSDIPGDRLPTDAMSCRIDVTDEPTATPRATSTPTPEGFCNGDGDCNGGVCIDNRCATPTPPGFCNDESDCPAGQVCTDNRCATPSPSATPKGFCRSDEDCSGSEVCIADHCTLLTPTPPGFCTSDEQCPPNQLCIAERCATLTPTPQGFCNDDSDCPTGTCIENFCTEPTATPTQASRGGGGGCSCSIEPDPPTRALLNLVLALLPVAWLAWARRPRLRQIGSRNH